MGKLKKGESQLFDVEILAGENLGEACERVAKAIGANWWSNEARYGNETFFECR